MSRRSRHWRALLQPRSAQSSPWEHGLTESQAANWRSDSRAATTPGGSCTPAATPTGAELARVLAAAVRRAAERGQVELLEGAVAVDALTAVDRTVCGLRLMNRRRSGR